MTAYNGILELPEVEQSAVLRILGFRQDLSAHVGAMVVGLRHAVQVDQAGGVAFRRAHGRAWSFPGPATSRMSAASAAVPPHDRHRADDPRSRGHPGAGDGQRHQAEARSKA